jgi:D-glycero-alpha-D-manno-heptose-7-phosphate kinase
LATKKSLLKGDLLEFGKLLDVAWQTKKNFTQGVSNERIEHLYSVAKAHGAVGGKLLGAGNGGFLLFYCLPLQRYRVKMALQNEGTTTMTFKFDNHGVYVWHSPHQPEHLEMEDMCKP